MPFSLAIAETIKAYASSNNKNIKELLDDLIKKQEKFYMEVYKPSHMGIPSMTGFGPSVNPTLSPPQLDIRSPYTQPQYSTNK